MLSNVGIRVAALLAVCWTGLYAADNSTITQPFVGVTHIFRAGSPPEFPRNVNMHVIKIDLTARMASPCAISSQVPFLAHSYPAETR